MKNHLSIRFYLIPFLVALILFSQCKKGVEVPIAEREVHDFYAYNFGGLDTYTPDEQVNMLADFEYSGITLPVYELNYLDTMNRYIAQSDSKENFKVQSVFFRYIFKKPDESREIYESILQQLEGSDTEFWFIFGRPVTNPTLDEVEQELIHLVDLAAKKNIDVVLYPHVNCYFYSAEQALPTLEKLNRPNLSVAVHTCHEMRAGNGNRLDAVVLNVKNHLGAVTIAGADLEVDTTSNDTKIASTIQPLEDGAFNYGPMIGALSEIDYDGPVGFINFRISKTPSDYLPKSLNEWRRLESLHFKPESN